MDKSETTQSDDCLSPQPLLKEPGAGTDPDTDPA